MKKFIIAILLIVGSFGYANAQTVKKTAHKKTTTTATTATTAPAVSKKETKVEKSSTHLKKDGTADKRYKESKTTTTVAPMKKNGTPDMRYKANKKK
ncbi:MAG: hypothetical protein ABI374_08440 [Ginsengibacter sp.]